LRDELPTLRRDGVELDHGVAPKENAHELQIMGVIKKPRLQSLALSCCLRM
jgi:hypothetical protein